VFYCSVRLLQCVVLVAPTVEDLAATRREGLAERVSDCCRAVVPVGRVVTGSESEVPPRQTSPLRGGGSSESRFVQAP